MTSHLQRRGSVGCRDQIRAMLLAEESDDDNATSHSVPTEDKAGKNTGKRTRTVASAASEVVARVRSARYECSDCGMSFSRIDGYNNHVQREHHRRLPYKCMECDKRFASRFGVRKHIGHWHMRSASSGGGNKHCLDCGQYYRDKETHRCKPLWRWCKEDMKTVTKNVKNDKEREKYACSHCSRTFKRQDHLLSHVRLKHRHEMPYKCGVCNKRFSYLTYLKSHMTKMGHVMSTDTIKSLSHVTEGCVTSTDCSASEDDLLYKCQKCCQQFDRIDLYLSHVGDCKCSLNKDTTADSSSVIADSSSVTELESDAEVQVKDEEEKVLGSVVFPTDHNRTATTLSPASHSTFDDFQLLSSSDEVSSDMDLVDVFEEDDPLQCFYKSNSLILLEHNYSKTSNELSLTMKDKDIGCPLDKTVNAMSYQMQLKHKKLLPQVLNINREHSYAVNNSHTLRSYSITEELRFHHQFNESQCETLLSCDDDAVNITPSMLSYLKRSPPLLNEYECEWCGEKYSGYHFHVLDVVNDF